VSDALLQLEERAQLWIKSDVTSVISDGRHLVIRAAQDAFLAACLVINNSDQKNVFRRPFARYERLDRGLDVLTEIESLEWSESVSSLEVDASDNRDESNHKPEHKVTVYPTLKVPDPSSSFFG
jgi:hypothetical protein